MKKILLLTFSMGMFAFLFVHTPSIFAEDGQTYEVTADSVNVRSSPSDDAEVMGTLNQSDHIVKVQESFGWYQTYYDGEEAWVASQFLSLEDDEDGEQGAQETDSQDGMNTPALSDNEQEEEVESGNDGTLANRTIVIDPGHGGKDPGALSLNNTNEKDYTLGTAEEVSQTLEDAGAEVVLTRMNDSFISLPARNAIYGNADAFISIHYNSYSDDDVNGFSTHYQSTDDALAQNVESGLEDNLTLHNRGTEESNFQVLRESDTPAVLLELGYITNEEDLSAIQTADFQNAVGEGITNGLMDYFK